MERLLAVIALFSFLAKLTTNVIFLEDGNKTFAIFDTDLTPVGSPLLICRAFFASLYTMISTLYFVGRTLRRNDESFIIDKSFYLWFSFACTFESLYATLWAFQKTVFAFAFICIASLCQYVALYHAYTGLYYAKANKRDLEASTIWCNRVFVQSALIFDCAWNSVLAILTLAVILCYSVGLTSFQASVIGLIIFAIGLLIWFLIENLAVEKYVRFAVIEYIAISIALTSLLSRDRVSESYFPVLLLSLMATVLILLFLRVFLIVCMENRRKNQDRLYTMVAL